MLLLLVSMVRGDEKWRVRNAMGFLYPSWMENRFSGKNKCYSIFSLDLDFKTLIFGVEVICKFCVTL
jgi:hypothetical protein